jgi:IclR family pca regulon transcriptional regulator
LAKRDGKEYSETLEKGLRIFDLFNKYHQGLRLIDISNVLGINKTTTYRFVNSYCNLGYLRRDATTKLFRLGPRSIALGYSVLQNSDLVRAIRPIADQITKQYKIHVDVGLLHKDSIFIIYRQESADTIKFRHFTSTRGMHYLAMGKAALAFLPENEMKESIENIELEKKTGATIISKTELIDDLKVVAKRGYSWNNEEMVPGLISIGAPLINLHTSRVEGAVSFDSSTAIHSMEEFEHCYSKILIELAKEVSTALPII